MITRTFTCTPPDNAMTVRESAKEFLRERFGAEQEYRPFHLSFEDLAALLAEYEMGLPPLV